MQATSVTHVSYFGFCIYGIMTHTGAGMKQEDSKWNSYKIIFRKSIKNQWPYQAIIPETNI